MTRAQKEYLRSREVEAFFHERVNLEFKGFNNLFAEFDVVRINNEVPPSPVTVGFCQFPGKALMYLSVDLSEDDLGRCRIEFELNSRLLAALHNRERCILFFDSVQTALDHLDAAMNSSGKHGTDIVCDADRSHFWPNEQTHSRIIPMLSDEAETSKDLPPEPILVCPSRLGQFSMLNPNCTYDISFSESCSSGKVSRYCTFTPADTQSDEAFVDYYEYRGLRFSRNSLDFMLENGSTIEFSFSGVEREVDMDLTEEEEEEIDIDRKETNIDFPEPRDLTPAPEPQVTQYIRGEANPSSAVESYAASPVSQPQKLSLNHIPDVLKMLEQNAWNDKNPKMIRFSVGENTIELRGFIYEQKAGQTGVSSSLSLNGEILYGSDTAVVNNEQTILYSAGMFLELQDALDYLKATLKENARSRAAGNHKYRNHDHIDQSGLNGSKPHPGVTPER